VAVAIALCLISKGLGLDWIGCAASISMGQRGVGVLDKSLNQRQARTPTVCAHHLHPHPPYSPLTPTPSLPFSLPLPIPHQYNHPQTDIQTKPILQIQCNPQEVAAALEAAAAECGLRLRPLEKKSEKAALAAAKARLLGLLVGEEEPAVSLRSCFLGAGVGEGC